MALPFRGNDHAIWGSYSNRDGYLKDGLVTMRARETNDVFTMWVSDVMVEIVALYDRMFTSDPEICWDVISAAFMRVRSRGACGG